MDSRADESASDRAADQPLTPSELRAQLDRFRHELRAAGLRESTVQSYLAGSSLFVRWLAGDYVPGPGRGWR